MLAIPEKLGGGVQHPSWNPYPISDQNLWFSLPYFRPEVLEPGVWLERMTSCYSTYTVVGVNIKNEMVLLPNDEEVANSSLWHGTYLYSPYKGLPSRGEKRVADYESCCLCKQD